MLTKRVQTGIEKKIFDPKNVHFCSWDERFFLPGYARKRVLSVNWIKEVPKKANCKFGNTAASP